MLENDTRNQHFLSKVEQKLNALNPQAKANNLKIYSFKLKDKDNYGIELENNNGISINKNLSILDLFSFDVSEDSNLRANFESFFQRYEVNIERNTKTLSEKLNSGSDDVRAEIIDLFAAKLINFVRNPYCIAKMLNTFPDVATYKPTDPTLLARYRRIVSGKKPHQDHLCSQLGISAQQYEKWLRVLFMLLMETREGGPNFFEETIKRWFENRKTQVLANVYEYDNDRCLLSDRGCCWPIPDGEHTAFSFNLCSSTFIQYIFADVRMLNSVKVLEPKVRAHVLASFEKRSKVEPKVRLFRNDRDMLARYNRCVIEQCYERVYCSAKDGLVLQTAER